MENFAPYSLAGDLEGAFNPANLNVGMHTVTITPYPEANLNGTPGPSSTIEFQVVDNPNPTAILLTEESSDQAVAFNAATFVREPFSVFTEQNLSSDKRTRVILFVADFEFSESDPLSDVLVRAENSALGTVSLPIEHIAKVPFFDWLTQIQVVLPDSLGNAGDVWVSISLRGTATNHARLRIQEAAASADLLAPMNLFRDSWLVPDLRFLWPVSAQRQNS
jgi:hypothetical protein